MTVYRILYRGSLSSCNYACNYCPFAKQKNTREELRADREQLERFVRWTSEQIHRLGIFFTPWGEAIIHRYYRDAMVKLTHLPNVARVAMQTNLSGKLSDLVEADPSKLALWGTFHPGEVAVDRFIARCEELLQMEIRFSVGVVGLRDNLSAIEQIRHRLPADIYVWVNAYKRVPDYYSDEELRRIRTVDPYFDLNRRAYDSFGKPCRAGQTSFTVDEHGNARRCHFVDEPIGNIYSDDIFAKLTPRPCPNNRCGCHIGYVHRPQLKLDELYGESFFERIPQHWPVVDKRFAVNEALAHVRAGKDQYRIVLDADST